MQKLFIIGNLTIDPQSKTTSDGKTVTNFTVAVNRRKTQQNQNPEADFFRVAAWNQLGENCKKYLAKGKKVAVVGTVSVRTYQAQDGSTRASMEVIAENVEFLSPIGTPAESSPAESTPAENAPAPAAQGGFTAVETDELPF